MALTDEEKQIIRALVKKSLDTAEAEWNKHGKVFEAATEGFALDSIAKRAEIVPSRIPNHPFVSSEHSRVAEYVCLVADMRESSKHLMQEYAGSKKTYTTMKRVYFETAALLPALDQTIEFEGGSVTEYLGDGVLALFPVNPDERGPDLKSSLYAARNCIGETRAIVNEELYDRYLLPELHLGVGLGFGNGIIQTVGVPSRRHAKVIGPCVYYATKLSGGWDAILVNESLKVAWPSSKGGKLRFVEKSIRDVSGYQVY